MDPVTLNEQLHAALGAAFAAAGTDAPPGVLVLRPCGDRKFGDYQANAAMVLAKALKRNPRDLAAEVAGAWASGPGATLASVAVAGPGFLNLTLHDAALAGALASRVNGLAPVSAAHPRTVVIDFSSPNVAKAMHVGHIRSTILGDCLARVMRFLGHRVITDNHIGDWGTQFGKLIVGYRKLGNDTALEADPIGEMERLYKAANEACDTDPALLDAARAELKKLQDGDPDNLALWQRFRDLSQHAFDRIYERLDVSFDHTLGESFYNPMLRGVVDDLLASGVARESEGAVAVFHDEREPRGAGSPFLTTDKATGEVKDAPFLIRKDDGAALYATTDLATLRYRVDEWKADEIWYVTDVRQSLHFAQLFATAKRMGIPATLCHVTFGAILGQDRKPFKTREGGTVKLESLLDEGVERAAALVRERRPELPDDKLANIAEVIGIGSVKYNDLAQNRHLDYVFEWSKLLAFDGNTAPYVLNALVRILSIFRKAEGETAESAALGAPTHERERNLMVQLLLWDDAVRAVAAEQRPHHLCFYLFELAGLFHSFFEECPVLKAETPQLRAHRLALCRATAETLRTGCELLGLRTLSEM